MARSSAGIRGGTGLSVPVLLVALLCVGLLGLAGAPRARAAGRGSRCKKGTVQVKVGGKKTCVARELVQPPPSKTHPFVAQVQGALAFTELSFKTRSGKRVKSFSQDLGKSWTTAQARLEGALSGMIARAQKTARRPLGALLDSSGGEGAGCAAADLLNEYGIDAGQNVVKSNSTASIDGVDVTLGLDSSGAHFGLQTTVQGNTYKMRYDSGELSCLAYKLPPCPNGDGSLGAYGLKGKVGFSLTVSRGGSVVKRESYGKTITVETRGQVAEDAKLDYVDVKYSQTTTIDRDGVHLTQYGNRTQRINMRTGGYDPGESVSFGSASGFGEFANVAGEEADAKDFGAFVSQTKSAYRERENAWQTPNQCAKLKFTPGSGTLSLVAGQQGSFSAEVDADADGTRAAKASWTLSGQQNATFTPTSSKDAQPSFSYEVSGSPGGETVSVVAKATSSAGVAQDAWSQKVAPINKIAGTFSGREDEEGVVFEWSGTVTFTRGESSPGGTIFNLTEGQASVSVSGADPAACTHSGTEEVQLVPQIGVFTLTGTTKPFQYQIIAPWNSKVQSGIVTVDCGKSGTFTQTEVPAAPAIQSGDYALGGDPTALLKTSADGSTFADSVSAVDPVYGPVSWAWSLKGS